MALSHGSKLGPYEIVSALGAGGMGEVYRALDTRLHRTVAIKILPQDKLTDTEGKKRFMQEARAASALLHPNIVVLHDISQDSGVDFLVMEYVEGQNLRDRIKKGALPLKDVISNGAQIASALAAAHAARIVHRDIKPANIMVTGEGRIKVLDFGLAKLSQRVEQSDAQTAASLTESGIIVGTVAYMSPEQTRGEALDARSDIFSLGCVLYETATGRQPFQGPSTLSVMHEIATADPPRPSAIKQGLPTAFDDFIAKALAKDKNDRFASAAEMAGALQAIPDARKQKRGGLAIPVIVAALLAITGFFSIRAWNASRGHVPDAEARQLYEQGRREIQEFTEHGFKQSVVDFTNAIKRDPDYAAAYAGLADAYSYQAAFEMTRPGDVMPLAESNAAKALEKDPGLAEAYASLGIVAAEYYRDLPLARQRFERALKIDPKNAFIQHYYGHYFEYTGSWDQALKQMQLALQMDKLSPMYGEDLSWDYLNFGRVDDAIRQLGETASLDPEDPVVHTFLALALEAKGQTDEALQQAEQAIKLPGMFAVAGQLSGVFSRLHRIDRVSDILKQLEAARKSGAYVAPVELAMNQFALGNKTEGFALVQAAIDEHSYNLVYFIADPVFDTVREDPEFATLMKKINVPPASWHDIPRYLKQR